MPTHAKLLSAYRFFFLPSALLPSRMKLSTEPALFFTLQVAPPPLHAMLYHVIAYCLAFPYLLPHSPIDLPLPTPLRLLPAHLLIFTHLVPHRYGGGQLSPW